MKIEELIYQLRRPVPEKDDPCRGCGYEHDCSTRGCAVKSAAADTIERLASEIEDAKIYVEFYRTTAEKGLLTVKAYHDEISSLKARYNAAVKALRRLDYDCSECAHPNNAPCYGSEEDYVCDELHCPHEDCLCRSCQHGSNWEWRGPKEECGK